MGFFQPSAGRSKFLPLHPSSQNSITLESADSGVRLIKPFNRFLWFVTLLDSIFPLLPKSSSSWLNLRYSAVALCYKSVVSKINPPLVETTHAYGITIPQAWADIHCFSLTGRADFVILLFSGKLNYVLQQRIQGLSVRREMFCNFNAGFSMDKV